MAIRRLGDLLHERASSGLLGRDRELAELCRSLGDDGPLVVHLHGIAGIGKSTLLAAFQDKVRGAGAAVVALDGRVVEPTPRGLFHELSESLSTTVADVEGAAETLGGLAERVVVTFDTFELLRLLDTWLRQVFLPALPENVRVVFVGREPPATAWLASPGWQDLFEVRELGPLAPEGAHELLTRSGMTAEQARRVNTFSRGHPLALELAISASRGRASLDLEAMASQAVVDQLSRLFLADLAEPAQRTALEAASVVRRATRSVLRAMLGGDDAAYDSLSELPFVRSGRDGLRLHDAVQTAIASNLRGSDPQRHRAYLRAAWRQLREEARSAGPRDLWRYTADMLYILENPVVREAFFPSGAQRLVVEPATAGDGDAVAAIAAAREGPEAAELLSLWWRRHPETFHVVRDEEGRAVGFYCMFDPAAVGAALLKQDPLTDAWSRHLRRQAAPAGQVALFIRRWLSVGEGEAPSPVQAAAWLDIKRTYMELRPRLRRVYLTVVDLATWAPVATDLGFVPLEEGTVRLDGSTYRTALLDFGPASVDGWLARLGAAELEIEEQGLLDVRAHELIVDGQRVALTPLEFGLLQYLDEHDGEAVSRSELVERVWGNSYEGGSNVVDVVVASLRRKLASQAGSLETVRGVGYRFRSPRSGRGESPG